MSGTALTPNSCSNAARLSGERVKPDTILNFCDLTLARVRTLAQRPRPTMPSFTGAVIAFSLLNSKMLRRRLLQRHDGGDVDLDHHARPRELADGQERVGRQRIVAEFLDAALAVVGLI